MPISDSGDNGLDEASNPKTFKNPSFFIAFTTCVVLVIPFVVITSMGSNLNRFLYGYDKYGNICGIKNTPILNINCSGKNMSLKPIARLKYYPVNRCFQTTQMTIVSDKCVDICAPPDELIFHRCYPPADGYLDAQSTNFKQLTKFLHAISKHHTTVLLMTLTGLVLILAMFVFLRWYYTLVTFCTITILQVAALFLIVFFIWQNYLLHKQTSFIFFLTAMVLIAYLICIIAFICFFRHDFRFMISLYDEALSAIFSTPKILIYTIISLAAIIISTTLLTFSVILIFSNQCLQQSEDPFAVEYKTNSTILIFGFYIFFVMLWIYGYVEGWLNMITAKYVSRYYLQKAQSDAHRFNRNHSEALIQYHLGTIACGSLIMSLFSWIRGLTEFLLRKTYIQSVLRDETFCKSSVQVISLLNRYWYNSLAIFGFHYILTYGVLCFVIAVTVSIGCWMHFESPLTDYARLAVLFGGIVTSVLITFVVQVLSVSVDTVFLCFCQKGLLLNIPESTIESAEKSKDFKEIESKEKN